METAKSGSAGAITAQIEKSVYSKVTWRIIPFLFLCYICAFLDRVNVGFAQLQMQQELGFGAITYSTGFGIFFIGYFFFEVPSNLLLEKFGARRWIARIMISWGIVSGAMMMIHSATAFYILRFLLGVAEAGFFPGIILYLTYWYSKQRRAQMVALFMTAIPVSGLVGAPISGWILQTFSGMAGLSGWQWLFIIEALPSIIVGVVTLFYLDDGPASAKWLNEDERKLVQHHLDVEKGEKSRHSLKDGLFEWRVWLFGIIYFGYVAGLYGYNSWLPLMIKATGVASSLTIGLLVAIPNGIAVVVMILASRSSDRMLERRWHLMVFSLACLLGFVLNAASETNTTLAVLAASIGLAGIMACLAMFWTVPTAILAGTAAAGGIALVNSVGNLAGFVGPYLLGYIKEATKGLSIGLLLLGMMAIIGGILVMIFGPRRAKVKAVTGVQTA